MKLETVTTVRQSEMTGECWLIQFHGLMVCGTCQYNGKRGCGGKKIKKTGKNEKGFKVPLNDRNKEGGVQVCRIQTNPA